MPSAGDFSAPFKKTICKFWREGRCERGPQCTWSHGDEDAAAQERGWPAEGFGQELGMPMVPPDASDGWAAPEECLGQLDDGVFAGLGVVADTLGPVLKTICKFWQEGRCKNGEFCTWAHGEHELGALEPAQSTDGLSVAGFGEELAGAAQPEEHVGLVKRTICKFWQEGRCRSGDGCTWAHGEHEIGTVLLESSPAGHGGMIAPRAPSDPAWADQLPLPVREPEAPGGLKRTLCKFWLEGRCRSGEACTWAHGEQEIGTRAPGPEGLQWSPPPQEAEGLQWSPPPQEAPPPRSWSGCGGAFGRGAAGGGWGGGFGRAGPAAAALGGKGCWGAPALPAPEQPLRRTPCKFWRQGLCERGDLCTWLHDGVEGAGVPVAERPSWGWQRDGGGQAALAQDAGPGMLTVRRTICKFWQEGTCGREPGRCTWAHGEQELGTTVLSEPREVAPPWKRPRLS